MLDSRIVLSDPAKSGAKVDDRGGSNKIWIKSKWQPGPGSLGSGGAPNTFDGAARADGIRIGQAQGVMPVGVGGGPVNWKDPQGNTALSVQQTPPPPEPSGGFNVFQPAGDPSYSGISSAGPPQPMPTHLPLGLGQDYGVGANGDGGGSPAATRMPQDDASYTAPAGGGGGFKAERAAPQDAGTQPSWHDTYPDNNLAPQQFGDPELSFEDALAACGPTAAIAFLRANGRNMTLHEAVKMAQEIGAWDQGGMHGPDSEVQLLQKMGVAAKVGDADPQTIAREVQNGNPVIVSSAGQFHYLVISGYDESTGTFYVGNTGTIWKDPARNKTWQTWDEIAGQGATAIYMDNPQSPTPSVAADPSVYGSNVPAGSAPAPGNNSGRPDRIPGMWAPTTENLDRALGGNEYTMVPLSGDAGGASGKSITLPDGTQGYYTYDAVLGEGRVFRADGTKTNWLYGPDSKTFYDARTAQPVPTQQPSTGTWPEQPPSSARAVPGTQGATSGNPPQQTVRQSGNYQPATANPDAMAPGQYQAPWGASFSDADMGKAFKWYAAQFGGEIPDPNALKQSFLNDWTQHPEYMRNALSMAQAGEVDALLGSQMQDNVQQQPVPAQRTRPTPVGSRASDRNDQRSWAPGVTDQPGWTSGQLKPPWNPGTGSGGDVPMQSTLGLGPDPTVSMLRDQTHTPQWGATWQPPSSLDTSSTFGQA